MSMKILNICLTVLITGACALSAHAGKQLKYVPQALKGAKAVPYVVKPQLSPVMRAQFAMPTVRPNLSAAVERQVAAQVTVEERIKRLETNLKKLEEYARTHDNRIPSISHSSTESSGLRKQIINDLVFLKRDDVLGKNHPLCQRYNQLVETDKQQQEQEKLAFAEQRIARLETNIAWLEEYARTHNNELPQSGDVNFHVILQVFQDFGSKYGKDVRPFLQRYNQLVETRRKQIRKEEREKEIQQEQQKWDQLLQQDAAWKAQPEEIIDPAENADKAAALGEQQLSVPSTITDDYVEQLLNFYNKLDPLGTGTIH